MSSWPTDCESCWPSSCFSCAGFGRPSSCRMSHQSCSAILTRWLLPSLQRRSVVIPTGSSTTGFKAGMMAFQSLRLASLKFCLSQSLLQFLLHLLLHLQPHHRDLLCDEVVGRCLELSDDFGLKLFAEISYYVRLTIYAHLMSQNMFACFSAAT